MQLRQLILAGALLASPALAHADCDTPAKCHLEAGQAALKATPPDTKRAVDELYASYQGDRRIETYALYAYALRLDHRYATSVAIWRRVKVRLEGALTDVRSHVADAQQAGDTKALQDWTNSIAPLEAQIQNADSELTLLESQTARVDLKYAGATVPEHLIVARKNEGDVADPFTKPILVNADNDTLVITYPDATTADLAVSISGGLEQTVVVPAHEPPVAPPPVTQQPATPVVVPQHPEPPPHLPPPAQASSRPWLGYGLVAGGAVALAAGGVFQLQSSHDWSDATASGAGCTDAGVCVRGTRGATLAQDSQDRAHLALGAVIVGGALAVTGIAALALHHGHRSELTVTPQPGGAAAVLSGRF
jgi:hypothetical protein|nr:hypothetical protein [Kofleriaceae bacterium]